MEIKAKQGKLSTPGQAIQVDPDIQHQVQLFIYENELDENAQNHLMGEENELPNMQETNGS